MAGGGGGAGVGASPLAVPPMLPHGASNVDALAQRRMATLHVLAQ
jgi:hypothetical protein